MLVQRGGQSRGQIAFSWHFCSEAIADNVPYFFRAVFFYGVLLFGASVLAVFIATVVGFREAGGWGGSP